MIFEAERAERRTSVYLLPAMRAVTAPLRKLIWIEEPHFLGWGCSECAWRFKPSGPPVGNSLQEMRDNYLRLRDDESAAHVCAKHPSAKKARIRIIRGQSLQQIPQRGTRARRGVARGRRTGSRSARANESISLERIPRNAVCVVAPGCEC